MDGAGTTAANGGIGAIRFVSNGSTSAGARGRCSGWNIGSGAIELRTRPPRRRRRRRKRKISTQNWPRLGAGRGGGGGCTAGLRVQGAPLPTIRSSWPGFVRPWSGCEYPHPQTPPLCAPPQAAFTHGQSVGAGAVSRRIQRWGTRCGPLLRPQIGTGARGGWYPHWDAMAAIPSPVATALTPISLAPRPSNTLKTRHFGLPQQSPQIQRGREQGRSPGGVLVFAG